MARMRNAPYLRITSVSKKFGNFTALQDVSLEIEEGEFVCFLGPSGCGKTTLLRAIAGLDIQTSGRIEQAGHDVSDLPPTERDFGIVFQSYALFPNLTVFQNIAYGLQNRRMDRRKIKARVDELLELVGLLDQAAKYPAQLSGGQQQRVALARALAPSPGLLLLDEPLSALDAKVRVQLRDEIKMLQQRLGVTTVMVTHDQEEALTMADRIVVMNQGVIKQVGTPLDIYARPANVFVASFVGAMNFLPARTMEDRRVRVDGIGLAASDDLNGLPPGSPVVVCVRPEDVVTRGVDATSPNAIEMLVDNLEFLGSFHRAILKASHDGSATAIQANFSVNLVRDLGIEAGKTLTVALPPDRLRILREG